VKVAAPLSSLMEGHHVKVGPDGTGSILNLTVGQIPATTRKVWRWKSRCESQLDELHRCRPHLFTVWISPENFSQIRLRRGPQRPVATVVAAACERRTRRHTYRSFTFIWAPRRGEGVCSAIRTNRSV